MIDAVRFRNFRALEDLTLELGPLTVLVGPNGCGKTSALEGLTRTALAAADRTHRTTGDASIEVRQGDRWLWRAGTTGPQDDMHRWGQAATRHAFRPTALRRPQDAMEAASLSASGDNIAQVIASMATRRRTALMEAFCELVPSIGDMSAKPDGKTGKLRLAFYDRWSGQELTPDQVSDGSLLTLALLTLAYQSDRLGLVGIEEPENGLHPYLLRRVLEIVTHLTMREQDPLQILLTTHSPLVLNAVPAEAVRFMRRDRDSGAVLVERAPTGEPDWAAYLEAFDDSLGEAWLSGGLGGVGGV
jgi:predicted ATPase